MTPASVTLFTEQLGGWARAAPELRVPLLEQLVTRGRPLVSRAAHGAGPDAHRFVLLGGSPAMPVPAGALTALTGPGGTAGGHWLRADPVTLRAGLTQVYLTGLGFPDYTADEQAQIAEAASAEFAQGGLELKFGWLQHWVVRVPDAPGFEFTPPALLVGSDVAEHLPAAPAARPWRRLMNDLQVVLHNHPVNVRRRQMGREVVNGVWFWGAGQLPPRPDPVPYRRVFSVQPVSAGMACRCGLEPEPLPPDGRIGLHSGEAVFIDWFDSDPDPAAALIRLEVAVERLLGAACGVTLRLYGGDGRGWQAAKRRPWHRLTRQRPLVTVFGTPGPAD